MLCKFPEIQRLIFKFPVETKRYKVPRFAQATTSLVIVDPLQQLSEAAPPVAMSRHEQFDMSLDSPITVQHTSGPDVGEMCLNKWILLSVMGTLFALIVIQTTVVLTFILKRIAARNAAKKLSL